MPGGVGMELARRALRQARKAPGYTRIETTARHHVLDELTGGLTDGLYERSAVCG
jgi:hypothetical protein